MSAERLLLAYKRWLSPALPPSCRFVPTCSEYAAQAVEAHGALRGGLLGLARLLRCHPMSRGGFDPVPAASEKIARPEANSQPLGASH